MNIETKQWKAKPKRIGKTKSGDDIVEVVTKGGLNLVVIARGSKYETIGVAPHRALSRFMAMQKLGDNLGSMELSKSESEVVKDFKHWDTCEALRDRLNGK